MLNPGTALPGQDYMDFGATFLGRSVWVKGQYTDGRIAYFTGLRIDGRNVLTINAGTHSPNGPISVLEVGSGLNYFTNPGEIRSVANVVLNPSLDISILQLEGDVFPGVDLVVGATPSLLEPIQIAGYGQFALQDGPLQLQDGNIRGLEQVVGFDNSALFSPGFAVLRFPGGTKPGYSGAPVFYGGDAIGIVIGGILGTQSVQRTDYVPLNTPGLNEFIAANLVVPEPGSAALFLLGGLFCLARSQRNSRNAYPI